MSGERHDVDQAVLNRYSTAAGACETELCCPVEYDERYLEAIPQEILERDYGCGDPSRHVRRGETVLDLGSGGGKVYYIASQIVGPEGRVIGVDMNDDMLHLAESHRAEVGDRIGYHNVEFHKARIQDLSALIADDSVDVVVSNCVLNLVREADRERLFAGIFRVLRRGGRAVIADIVSNQTVPQAMKDDPTLWSGCISGAFREDRFLQAFERAGFTDIRMLGREETPWQTVQGIEFRPLTVEAIKAGPKTCCGPEGCC